MTTLITTTDDGTWREAWDNPNDWDLEGAATVDNHRLTEGVVNRPLDGAHTIAGWIGGEGSPVMFGATGPSDLSHLSVLRQTDSSTGLIQWSIAHDMVDITEVEVPDPEKTKHVTISWNDRGDWFVRINDNAIFSGSGQGTIGLDTAYIGVELGAWVGPVVTKLAYQGD